MKAKKKGENELKIEVKNTSKANQLECACRRKNINLRDIQGVGRLINDMLEGRTYGKVKIRDRHIRVKVSWT